MSVEQLIEDESRLRRGEISATEFVERNFDALYEKHAQDMPYGVAKARDGDPYVWLENHYS